jgi:hypothetical protein
MKRHQQILLGVLAFQIILSVMVFWPREAVTSSGELVFPDLQSGEVVGLVVVDNLGERMALRKVEGYWVLPEIDDYPVIESNVAALLEKLSKLSKASVVARTEASHRPLQVSEDAFQRRLEVEVGGGKTTTLYLGSAPRYTATHFRVSGEPETYLTTEMAAYDVNVRFSAWVATAYAHIDPATMTRVVLENQQGSFEFMKEGDAWTLVDLADDEEMSPTSASALVRNASTLSLLKPLGTAQDPAYGLDAPVAVVTIYTEDGREHVLTVGAKDLSDNSYVVKSSDSPYFVGVAEYSVLALVENDRADFLANPDEMLDLP